MVRLDDEEDRVVKVAFCRIEHQTKKAWLFVLDADNGYRQLWMPKSRVSVVHWPEEGGHFFVSEWTAYQQKVEYIYTSEPL